MFPTNQSSREFLQEEREQIALVYRALVAGKQKRYLAMRESGRLLYWDGGDDGSWTCWVLYENGTAIASQSAYRAAMGIIARTEENLFVDAVVACGGLDFERIWFEEKNEEKSAEAEDGS